MKKITHDHRKKIDTYIKNGLDISELLEGYELKDENFAGAIIKKISRYNEKITNANFAHCIIGESNTETNFSGCDLRGSNFKGAKLLGRTVLKNADARNCNFHDTDLNEFDYQNTDFRGCKFCGCVLKLSSESGKGAIFDTSLLEYLKQGWIIK